MDQGYLEQIDKFYKGQLGSERVIQMGKTPDILLSLGVRQLPMVMKQSTLRKCIREPRGSRSAHQLGREIIEQLPERMEKPVWVIDNPAKQGLLLITEAEDIKYRKVVAAVCFNSSLKGMEVNEVKSAYGRENLYEFIKREKEAGHIVYENKTKARHLLRFIEK